jgi:hypothetical protein
MRVRTLERVSETAPVLSAVLASFARLKMAARAAAIAQSPGAQQDEAYKMLMHR